LEPVKSDGTAHPDAVELRVELPEPELRTRPELRGWVWTWMFGVAGQGNRTLNPQPNELPEVEAYLFAIALRQLFRSVQAAIAHATRNGDRRRSKALRAARDAFDKSVPHAVSVRDVLVHFDEYERGEGNIQKARKKAKKRPPSLNVFTKNDGTTVWLYVLDDDDHRLDVRSALDAADRLAESVLEILSD
jgi:hypothetical protein